MKRNIFTSAILLSGASLVGCSDSTPECNSADAKQLVIEIAQEELQRVDLFKEFQGMTFEVESVRTQSHDEKIDLYNCAADLSLTLKDNTNTIPITYTVQKTEDGDGTFYVEVFGL
ncbi:hypothetical protein [Thorsellia anophelis]|uniref:Lipoprotein n=1 Tax=Thorsellia anophelis DSM 18579 TaxID=1123402 RepID=A0A1I0EMB2_9GAMM|nr:hypothetical protein [Thorsellia anophelis]SET46606.1 hypothetical protein SAMN02583745_02446 [Thorsellia anophelis DSM 18579]